MATDTKALILRAKSTALATIRHAGDARERVKTQESRITQEVEGLAQHHTNLIFAVDATASREQFWQTSSNIQASMFFSVDKLGINMNVQLAFYSGMTEKGALPVTRWHNSPQALADEMNRISCVGGLTQIGKVMSHALWENSRANHRVNALILVADSCEESERDLVRLAQQLRQNGIALFVYDDEKRSGSRHADTYRIFKAIAQAAEGQYVPFDEKHLGILSDFLKNAVIMSTRSPLAAKVLEREMTTPEGRALALRNIQKLNSYTPR